MRQRPRPRPGDVAPRPASVPAATSPVPGVDLASVLATLGDAPDGEVEVLLDGPAATALRDFLRVFGHPTGGWLNRSWALPHEAVPALAHVAHASSAGRATVVRTLYDADGGRAPARLWITLTDDRRAPVARA
jgi:hypothetical protein